MIKLDEYLTSFLDKYDSITIPDGTTIRFQDYFPFGNDWGLDLNKPERSWLDAINTHLNWHNRCLIGPEDRYVSMFLRRFSIYLADINDNFYGEEHTLIPVILDKFYKDYKTSIIGAVCELGYSARESIEFLENNFERLVLVILPETEFMAKLKSFSEEKFGSLTWVQRFSIHSQKRNWYIDDIALCFGDQPFKIIAGLGFDLYWYIISESAFEFEGDCWFSIEEERKTYCEEAYSPFMTSIQLEYSKCLMHLLKVYNNGALPDGVDFNEIQEIAYSKRTYLTTGNYLDIAKSDAQLHAGKERYFYNAYDDIENYCKNTINDFVVNEDSFEVSSTRLKEDIEKVFFAYALNFSFSACSPQPPKRQNKNKLPKNPFVEIEISKDSALLREGKIQPTFNDILTKMGFFSYFSSGIIYDFPFVRRDLKLLRFGLTIWGYSICNNISFDMQMPFISALKKSNNETYFVPIFSSLSICKNMSFFDIEDADFRNEEIIHSLLKDYREMTGRKDFVAASIEPMSPFESDPFNMDRDSWLIRSLKGLDSFDGVIVSFIGRAKLSFSPFIYIGFLSLFFPVGISAKMYKRTYNFVCHALSVIKDKPVDEASFVLVKCLLSIKSKFIDTEDDQVTQKRQEDGEC